MLPLGVLFSSFWTCFKNFLQKAFRNAKENTEKYYNAGQNILRHVNTASGRGGEREGGIENASFWRAIAFVSQESWPGL